MEDTPKPPSAASGLELMEARVITTATDLWGDAAKAQHWYRSDPLAAFGSKTAEQLVRAGRGEELLLYMATLEDGAAG